MVDIHHAISKIYPDALYRVVDATAPPVVESIAEWLDARPIPTQGQLDTAAVECQAELDAEADTATQQAAALTEVLPHLNDLRTLAPDAAMYALLARFGAIFNGETQGTIDAIVDRQSAGNYIQSTAQWTGLSAAQRQWAILELEMIARAMQAIVSQL